MPAAARRDTDEFLASEFCQIAGTVRMKGRRRVRRAAACGSAGPDQAVPALDLDQ